MVEDEIDLVVSISRMGRSDHLLLLLRAHPPRVLRRRKERECVKFIPLDARDNRIEQLLMLINLTIKPTAQGEAAAFVVSIDDGSTVSELKEAIAQRCPIAAENQRTIYRGQILKNEQTIASYGGERTFQTMHPCSHACIPALCVRPQASRMTTCSTLSKEKRGGRSGTT